MRKHETHKPPTPNVVVEEVVVNGGGFPDVAIPDMPEPEAVEVTVTEESADEE